MCINFYSSASLLPLTKAGDSKRSSYRKLQFHFAAKLVVLTEVDHDEAVVGDELVYLFPVEVLYQYLQR